MGLDRCRHRRSVARDSRSRRQVAHVMSRVMVMMSGGVDSSVAAAMLRDEGHDVTGVTLKLWGGESDSGCCSVSDVEDARRGAAQLRIPPYVLNFSQSLHPNSRAPQLAAHPR